METKYISFDAPKTASLQTRQLPALEEGKVLVKTEYTVVSGGTERAYLMGMNNTLGKFPMRIGYCGIGRVLQVGDRVTQVAPGDRVLVYHGGHSQYSLVDANRLTKIENDNIPSLEAAFSIIASMGLGGVRKLEVELGESAMVMGLGLLGMFSVQFLRLSGAYPVIAADLNPDRRTLALQLGADYALDPSAPDFTETVMNLTGGKGINACVEVTGTSIAMNQALQCAARQGRISLLGCTRVSDCQVDYYQQVHRPGVTLIGAHNMVRPKVESYPHHWTHQDDCKAVLDLLHAGRIQVKPIISRIESPENATVIYRELCDDPQFPLGTVFDWRNVE